MCDLQQNHPDEMLQEVLDAGFLGLNGLHNELEPIDNNLFYQR